MIYIPIYLALLAATWFAMKAAFHGPLAGLWDDHLAPMGDWQLAFVVSSFWFGIPAILCVVVHLIGGRLLGLPL